MPALSPAMAGSRWRRLVRRVHGREVKGMVMKRCYGCHRYLGHYTPPPDGYVGPQYDCSGTDDVMLCPEWIEGMVENCKVD